MEHIDLLEDVVEKRAKEVLVRLWSIREHGFDAAYQQAAESAVSIINDVIQQEASRRSFEILELRTLFDDRADYANPIEPSAIGGAKLAKCMSN